MKRFLLSLVALLITSVCFAQDVIVKKDGSTIQAKVLKVTQSEVEYKKFDNQNGPTYTIATKDLQSINYENGSKDIFVSENYNPSIVTNETATQYSNDKELVALYNAGIDYNKKAKRLKTIGWIAGGTLVLTGDVLCVLSQKDDYDVYTDWTMLGIGIGTSAIGIGIWAGCYFTAKHLEKKSQYSVHSAPLYQHEFKVGKNSNLMVGVDMLKDNTLKNQTLGLGLSYNF